MTTLASLAGIEIDWAADGTLTFADDLLIEESFPRPRSRLRSVALDPASCQPDDQVQYWMYNGIARRMDYDKLSATSMRYELTLMFPRALGRERAKTLGHLHSFPADSRLNYPEICEVLYGTAYFVFQTMKPETRSAPFCAVLEAHPGDKVIIPPNLHHLTINAGDEPLLFSDVIPYAVKGIYEPLATMRGAAYLNTRDAGWITNPYYSSIGELHQWQTNAYPELNLTPQIPLYKAFVEAPEYLAWMLHPERFSMVFPDIWSAVSSAIVV
jgi:glucose-6-phosphate isomerase